ncbi:hypothetical protein [Foetidibacter luteolus]|uniref:hypothetical protein n=1 Tax=Foetidibacter luteolus TaxID=2608880 RepID=UPI00129B609D|nr:hypothetical protein [Foetidibacter luteolus]
MKYVIFILLLATGAMQARAQGCSDAGFCSIGVLKNNTHPGGKVSRQLNIGAGYGLGQENTSIINPYVEYQTGLGKKWALQTKLTAAYATGFLGSNFNLGDIYVFSTYAAVNTPTSRVNLLGGIKAPLSSSNNKYQGKPLPLDYQASIGTWDFIAGINYIINNKWEINGGLQVPVIQRNKNTFFPDEFMGMKADGFAPTNNFRRKSDVLARLGYYIQLAAASISIKPNLLAIYHTGKDSYEDRFGKRTTLQGSAGLTLNAGIAATKKFTNGNILEVVAATPFITRDVRPDGLTRSAVFNVQYSFVL